MNIEADFEDWWARYPRKRGKLAAKKAYDRARRTHSATREELLAGIDAYLRSKPGYADFCHPTTWLNQGRWLDAEDEIPAQATRPYTAPEIERYEAWRRSQNGCGHSPRCEARAECMALFINRRLRGAA